MVAYQDGELKTEGGMSVDIFGGRIEVLDMYAKDLFASSRKIGGDIVFSDIDLGKITETIKIGRITGIVGGSMKDLQIEYGQPSRFVFDLDTVKKSGVSRKVSVDAIENISILGTGTRRHRGNPEERAQQILQGISLQQDWYPVHAGK